jgi:hypothetical protein
MENELDVIRFKFKFFIKNSKINLLLNVYIIMI